MAPASPRSISALAQRLVKTRKILADRNHAAIVVPRTDPHGSEYLADCDSMCEYISGFTGSNAQVVVTLSHAMLWTDGRYFLQADQQLGEGWTLMKMGLGDQSSPTVVEWLKKNIKDKEKIWIDAELVNVDEYKEFVKELGSDKLVLTGSNPIAEVWEDRPTRPSNEVREHPHKYSGETRREKLERLQKVCNENKVTLAIATALEDIAWLLNLRGSDLEMTPVFYGYFVLRANYSDINAYLFTDSDRIPPNIKSDLASDGVQLKPYNSLLPELSAWSKGSHKAWLDGDTCNAGIYHLLSEEDCSFHDEPFPTVMWKCCKNSAEIEGI